MKLTKRQKRGLAKLRELSKNIGPLPTGMLAVGTKNYNQPKAMRRRSNTFDVSTNNRRSKEKESKIVESELDEWESDEYNEQNEREPS